MKKQVFVDYTRHVSFDEICRKAAEQLGCSKGKGWVRLVGFLDTGDKSGTIRYCFELDELP
jgi:hypothetical protein